MTTKINIAIIDDHGLYRKGLIKLIKSLNEDFEVVLESSNGSEFLKGIKIKGPIDLAIVDIEMPGMSGFEIADTLKTNFPKINVLIISMLEDELSLIKMLRLGVKGFLSKDVEPRELKAAIESVAQGNFHHNEAISTKLIKALQSDSPLSATEQLNDRELKFLKHCCSEFTYKEIADKMCLSPKTIDGYRANLFESLGAKSRVGLVMYAIKNGIVAL